MMTLNDAILSALGGQPINDGLAQYYLATGGSGSNLYDIERSWLVAKIGHDSGGTVSDLWREYLAVPPGGSLNDGLLLYWSGGGENPPIDFSGGALDPRVSFSRSSTGTYTGADGLLKTAAIDEPRFDHNPATGAVRGLLVEEQRTNDICKYNPAAVSGKFEWWGSAPESVRYVASPDGATDGVVPKPIATTRRWQMIFPAGSLANGSSHSISWHEKQVPPTGGTGQVIGPRSWIGVSPSAITSTPSGSGYTRKSVVATVTNNASDMIFRFYLDGPSGADDLAVWGWQFESSVATPSSYIPAAGASVTRSADVATFTIPPRVVRLVTIYDDGTTSQQTVTPGASYTIPTGQKPILRIRGYFA